MNSDERVITLSPSESILIRRCAVGVLLEHATPEGASEIEIPRRMVRALIDALRELDTDGE